MQGCPFPVSVLKKVSMCDDGGGEQDAERVSAESCPPQGVVLT